MAYELILAQSLSITLGDTIQRYVVTIGLYLASLGAGALAYAWIRDKFMAQFAHVEALLSLLGGSAVILSIMFSKSMIMSFAVGHSLIVIIGFLSGMELPMLIALAGGWKASGPVVLCIDYIGSLLAAISFPYLFSSLGLVQLGFITAIANLASGALYMPRNSKVAPIIYGLLSFLLLIGLYCWSHLEPYFMSRFYL
ncbi:MAG: hypothetical protein HQL31_10180 [Planctomycetes bacterium]|nr:hypothetical protein [Planctomycetota bacterium]